jgi:hypothetical protein
MLTSAGLCAVMGLVLALLNPQILLLEVYFIVIDQQILCHVFFIVDDCC